MSLSVVCSVGLVLLGVQIVCIVSCLVVHLIFCLVRKACCWVRGEVCCNSDPRNDISERDRSTPKFLKKVDLGKLLFAPIEEWCGQFSVGLKHVWYQLSSAICLVLRVVAAIVVSTAGLAIGLIFILGEQAWPLVKVIVFAKYDNEEDVTDQPSPKKKKEKVGLKEKTGLPSTGEEAVKRLLSCQGKDPYSILGVRTDSSDEDIKRYYKKQAVLVHPDKNHHPRAGEAFIILRSALEIIGDPLKRKQYDSREQDEIDAMNACMERLYKLQAEIREAANILSCNICHGKHRRIPIDRPFYSARYCSSCNKRHKANEGDVWAETPHLWCIVRYYALMEGRVFDITVWMECQADLKYMAPNSHNVTRSITTNRIWRTQEPTIEELIDHIFGKYSDVKAWWEAKGNSSHGRGDAGFGNAGADMSTGCSKTRSQKEKKRRKKKKR